jgi:hypothetical protein
MAAIVQKAEPSLSGYALAANLLRDVVRNSISQFFTFSNFLGNLERNNILLVFCHISKAGGSSMLKSLCSDIFVCLG